MSSLIEARRYGLMEANYPHAELTSRILGCAYNTHSILGPGLLESTYRTCIAYEMTRSGLAVSREQPISIRFRDLMLEASYRADLVVDDSVLIELKAVEKLLPIHEAQTLTYLRHSGLRVGLLINFNVPRLKLGLRRFVNN
jgi:GxxExxY protein